MTTNLNETWKKLDEARAALRKACPDFPRVAIVLGSGLAALLDQIATETVIPFADVPHLKPPSVEGHVGRIVIGKLGRERVACLLGRLHFYEGHTLDEVVFPYRALALAGVTTFFLTNAAGGLQPGMVAPALMVIRDHINLTGTNPLIGRNDERLGPRFPDLTRVYDDALSERVLQVGKKLGIALHEGVYIGISGPAYETPAEIRMYRTLGADAVGMSTVPEAIAIRHMGRRVVGVSCIANLAAGVEGKPLVHTDVLEAARKIHPIFARLITEAVQGMGA